MSLLGKLTGLVKLVSLTGTISGRIKHGLAELLLSLTDANICSSLVKRMSTKDRRLVVKLCEKMGDTPFEDELAEALRQALRALRDEIDRQKTPEPTPEPEPAPSPEPTPAPEPAPVDPTPAPSPEPPVADADEIPFSSLKWEYGGADCHKAEHAKKAVIASLKVGSSNMTYSWKSGGCENLGASSASDSSKTLACFFVERDGAYRGGKFEWISTSRTSRSFTNITKGYHGWPKDAVASGKKFAFCICSDDGKKRTNVIACSK